jgi:hypothetical protein
MQPKQLYISMAVMAADSALWGGGAWAGNSQVEYLGFGCLCAVGVITAVRYAQNSSNLTR